MILGAVEFPDIKYVIEWPAFLFKDSTLLAFNKIALIHFLGLVIPTAVFLFGTRGDGLVPRGARAVSEGVVSFIDTQIIQAAIGHDGRKYLPLLTSFFLFVFFGNITEVIPFFQMPANARMAGPLVLALVAWAMFISVGLRHHGLGYFLGPQERPLGLPPGTASSKELPPQEEHVQPRA